MIKIDISKVLIGSDFELFIVDEDDNFVSAIPFIEGTKNEPLPVSPLGHAIQHDGALAEANVPPVLVNSGNEMWENIQFVISEMQTRLPKELKIKCCPNGEFKDTELEDPEARQFGCDPDFSAWRGGEINKKPDADGTNKRCCGLHWHFSFPGATPRNVMRLIRILDVHVTLPMLFEDEDRERRTLYGKAGCFRFKDYGNIGGVEYRSLSNAGIKNKEIFDFVWGQLLVALETYNKGIDYLEFGDQIQEAIDTYNLNLAEDLIEELNVNMYEAA